MGFPVEIGPETVGEDTFSGLGYLDGILILAELLGKYAERLPYGTSSTEITMGTGSSKIFEVEKGRLFHPLESVRVYYNASNYMEGTVESYDESFGEYAELSVYPILVVGSGTYSDWKIHPVSSNTPTTTPSVTASNVTAPIPIYAGGSPSTTSAGISTALRAESGANVITFGSNFFHRYDSSNPYPFYVETSGGGTLTSEGNYTYSISGDYPGLWTMRATNPADKVFLSYGSYAFIQLETGGDLELTFRILGPVNIDSEDCCVFRAGLMSATAESLGDQFSSFGFGVEIAYLNSSDSYATLSFVVNDTKETKRIPSATIITPSSAVTVFIRYNASDKTVIMSYFQRYVRDFVPNSTPAVFVFSLEEFFNRSERESSVLRKASLLKPFFYTEKVSGTTAANTYVDLLHVTRSIKRL